MIKNKIIHSEEQHIHVHIEKFISLTQSQWNDNPIPWL